MTKLVPMDNSYQQTINAWFVMTDLLGNCGLKTKMRTSENTYGRLITHAPPIAYLLTGVYYCCFVLQKARVPHYKRNLTERRGHIIILCVQGTQNILFQTEAQEKGTECNKLCPNCDLCVDVDFQLEVFWMTLKLSVLSAERRVATFLSKLMIGRLEKYSGAEVFLFGVQE